MNVNSLIMRKNARRQVPVSEKLRTEYEEGFLLYIHAQAVQLNPPRNREDTTALPRAASLTVGDPRTADNRAMIAADLVCYRIEPMWSGTDSKQVLLGHSLCVTCTASSSLRVLLTRRAPSTDR